MQLPFGLRVSDSRMVAPTEVPNGEGCGCVCPGCNAPLVAKQGAVKEWHFAHARGAECANATESALHKMAKQLIMDRRQIYVPGREWTRKISGPHDEFSHEFAWQKTLVVEIQVEGLIGLSNCVEEERVENRRPDVLAYIDGNPIAIEVAATHFCDAEKLAWLKERNLTTIEIDIGLPPSIPLIDILPVLEARLFQTAAHSVWLYHAGDSEALKRLDADERHLREIHAETDRAFEAAVSRKRADQKRKDEFKEKIRDIDAQSFNLGRRLTLRVAHSEVRCTMKWHEYFDAGNEKIKQLILDTAKRYSGRYNVKYEIWEFWPPPTLVRQLYQCLIDEIERRVSELPPPPPPKLETPQQQEIRKFRDDEERELFEELAAIREYEGGLSRDEAERAAFVEILRRRVIADDKLPF